MYHSAEDFQNAVIKMAQFELEDNGNAMVSGEQRADMPEMLQPEKGTGEGSRNEYEAFSEGAEKAHADNREGKGGYLDNAFKGFQQAARQDGAELSNMLDSFGPKAIVSKATAQAGQKMKLSSVSIGAFTDELDKIAVGDTVRGRNLLLDLARRVLKRPGRLKVPKNRATYDRIKATAAKHAPDVA